MPRRGHNRALPEALKIAKGTDRPGRKTTQVVPTLEGDLACPSWLKGRARTLWTQKVAIYAQRKQSVVGCEGALAQYCALEAELERRWKKGIEIPMAMINGHRLYASEFYDTSASQQQGPKKADQKDNPFAGNGKRPELRLA